MRMRADEIIELFNLVTLQRVEHHFVFAGVAGIDENSFARGRNNQDRITVDWSNIKYVHLQLAAGRSRRLGLQRGQKNFQPTKPAAAMTTTSTAAAHPQPFLARPTLINLSPTR